MQCFVGSLTNATWAMTSVSVSGPKLHQHNTPTPRAGDSSGNRQLLQTGAHLQEE